MTPDNFTIQEVFIEVGDGHQIYAQEWGNQKAKDTIIVLHGGPGGGCSDKKKRHFDPNKHHVIFFDQRGAGRSLPKACLEYNTTDHLIGDISKIADHFGLEKFIFFGGSWGSCLAFAYALKHPERVASMILNSIYTSSKFENDWLDNGRFRTHYPEVWERYLAKTPPEHHDNPAVYHSKNILGNNEPLALSSAMAVEEAEHNLMVMDDTYNPVDPETFDPTAAKIFTHYITHGCFMPDRYVIDNVHKLRMPVHIVHGRYDMDCPPITAYEISKDLPNGTLTWVLGSHRAEHEMMSVLSVLLARATREI
jgi:proline iminopeptidase